MTVKIYVKTTREKKLNVHGIRTEENDFNHINIHLLYMSTK